MFDQAVSTRLLRTLFVTQSLFSSGFIAMVALLSIVSVQLSGDESTAGIPSAIQTFSQALVAYPMGLIMGRFGRRAGLTLGYGGGILGALFGVLAINLGSFPLLLLSAVLVGAGRSGTEQSRFAAGELFPEHLRARKVGQIVFAGTIGAVLGPLLVAPSSSIVEGIGLDPQTGPWAAAVFFYTLAALLTFLLLRPDPMRIAERISEEDATNRVDSAPLRARPLRDLLRLPAVQLAIMAMLISQTVMVVVMVMTPLHMHHHHHDNAAVSLVIAAHTLGMFGLSSLTGYLVDRFGRIRMMIAAALTLIISVLLAPLSAEMPVLVVALFLLGLGWNFGYVAGSTLLADSLQGAERSRVQGINDALVALSAGVGTLSAGPLFAANGYLGVSLLSLALTLVMVASIFWLSPRRARQQFAQS